MNNNCKHCIDCTKNTHRDEETKKKLNKRLKTIEGQIRGVQNMINEDKYCNDILIQLLAINKSIKSVSNEIFKNHLSTCDRKSTRLNSSHSRASRMPSSA